MIAICGRFAILSLVDMATKYQAAALVTSEQGSDLIKGIGAALDCPLRPSSPTKDAVGHLVICRTGRSPLNILHEIAPGEAHTRLSLVERRHAVLRKAVELYMHDLKVYGVDGIKQALCYVVPEIHGQATVAGYSPSQRLFGYQPSLPGTMLADRINPLHLQESFEETLYRRTAARTALLQADVDEKLRRALLRRYAGTNQRLMRGQLCFYWRDSRQARPGEDPVAWTARVLMVEEDKDGKPTTYWISHKTQLIRCAPHHVRPDFQQIEKHRS